MNGENGDGNGDRNGEGQKAWTEQDQERRKGEEMCWSTGASKRGRVTIRFSTYNIRNVRNGGLELELRGMPQDNIYPGIFQDMELTDGVYNRGLARYIVVATDAPSRHFSRVAVFYQTSPKFSMDAVQRFGTNVVGFQLTMVHHWMLPLP